MQDCGYGQKASTSDPSKARCPDKGMFHCYYGHTTHHALPSSIAVSDDIGAFVLGRPAATQVSWIQEVLNIIQSTTPVLPVC